MVSDGSERLSPSPRQHVSQVERNSVLTNGSQPVTLKEVQSWWRVAAVIHFSSVFRSTFSLPEFEFEDFEDALLRDRPGEENLFLCYLTIDMLKGCVTTSPINFLNFNDRLNEFISSQSDVDPNLRRWFFDGNDFNSLKTFDKVRLIFSICDYRISTAEATLKTQEADADSLRIEPLGMDSKGNTFWYFYGSRLYCETAPPHKPPHVEDEGTPSHKKSKKKKRKHRKRKAEDETEFFADLQEPSEAEIFGEWSLVASSLSDWEQLADRYKDSKRSRDRDLYAVLSENFLPILPSIIEAEENAREKRLQDLENTRQSSRLEEKRKERELMKVQEEEMRRMEEWERREQQRSLARAEELRKQEAADQERMQKEEAKALLRDERQRRAAMREERAALIREGKPLPAHMIGTSFDSPMPSPTHHAFEDCSSDSAVESCSSSLTNRIPTYSSLGSQSSRKRALDVGGSSADDDELDEEEITTAMLKILSEVESHKDAFVFLNPVTEDIAPGYSSVIKNPMCLADMHKKLGLRLYRSVSNFVQDGLLMFENCWHYNGRTSEYGLIATSVRKVFVSAVRRHLSIDIKEKARRTATGGRISSGKLNLGFESANSEEPAKPKRVRKSQGKLSQYEDAINRVTSRIDLEGCLPDQTSTASSSGVASSQSRSSADASLFPKTYVVPVTSSVNVNNRRKQVFSSEMAPRPASTITMPSDASEEVKNVLNGSVFRASRVPSFKKEVRLPSIHNRGFPAFSPSNSARYSSLEPKPELKEGKSEGVVQGVKEYQDVWSTQASTVAPRFGIDRTSYERTTFNLQSGSGSVKIEPRSQPNSIALGFATPSNSGQFSLTSKSDASNRELLTEKLKLDTQLSVSNFLNVAAKSSSEPSRSSRIQHITSNVSNSSAFNAAPTLSRDKLIGYATAPCYVRKIPAPGVGNRVPTSAGFPGITNHPMPSVAREEEVTTEQSVRVTVASSSGSQRSTNFIISSIPIQLIPVSRGQVTSVAYSPLPDVIPAQARDVRPVSIPSARVAQQHVQMISNAQSSAPVSSSQPALPISIYRLPQNAKTLVAQSEDSSSIQSAVAAVLSSSNLSQISSSRSEKSARSKTVFSFTPIANVANNQVGKSSASHYPMTHLNIVNPGVVNINLPHNVPQSTSNCSDLISSVAFQNTRGKSEQNGHGLSPTKTQSRFVYSSESSSFAGLSSSATSMSRSGNTHTSDSKGIFIPLPAFCSSSQKITQHVDAVNLQSFPRSSCSTYPVKQPANAASIKKYSFTPKQSSDSAAQSFSFTMTKEFSDSLSASARNPHAISSNQQLPLSGNPTTVPYKVMLIPPSSQN